MGRTQILAVCTANICRSPAMEVLLGSRLDADRFGVSSAGVQGWPAAPVDSMVRMELVRLGIDPTGFASRRLRAQHIAESDLILTATKEHRAAVLELDPSGLRKTFTLLEFAALAEQQVSAPVRELVANASRRRSSGPSDIDVPDPFKRSPATHRRVADLINDATARIAAVLNSLPVDQDSTA